MTQIHHTSNLWPGTLTGSLFSVLPLIFVHEILKTVILSITGITVSFFLSLLVEWLKQKRNKNKPP